MSANAGVFSGGSAECDVQYDDLVISMDNTLGIDAIFTITSSVGGDTIISSPLTIVAGDTFNVFSLLPTTCGVRTITISTSTVGVTITDPTVNVDAVCHCPDDAGATDEYAIFGDMVFACPPSLSVSSGVSSVSSAGAAAALYCTGSPVTIVITE